MEFQIKIILLAIILSFGTSIGTILLIENDETISVKKINEDFLGKECPENHFLTGHSSSGELICKKMIQYYENIDGHGIRKIWQADQLDHTFYTNSTTYVSTEFPANNKFIKKYDNSEIWAILTIDHINSEIGRTNFIALGYDGVVGRTIWAYDFSKGGAIQAFTGVSIVGDLKAGEHTINIDVAVNGGEGEFKTHFALLDVYEVPIG